MLEQNSHLSNQKKHLQQMENRQSNINIKSNSSFMATSLPSLPGKI